MNFFSYVPLKFVISSPVTNHVRSITLKPFKIPSWYFIQILTNIRQHAECKNHNYCIDTFWVTSLWTSSVAVSVTKSCPLYNFKTVRDMFIKFHTSIKHHKMTCRAQLLNVYFFSYSPFKLCKKQFCDKIVSVLDMWTIKDIFLKVHTSVIRLCAEHKNHNSCL